MQVDKGLDKQKFPRDKPKNNAGQAAQVLLASPIPMSRKEIVQRKPAVLD